MYLAYPRAHKSAGHKSWEMSQGFLNFLTNSVVHVYTCCSDTFGRVFFPLEIRTFSTRTFCWSTCSFISMQPAPMKVKTISWCPSCTGCFLSMSWMTLLQRDYTDEDRNFFHKKHRIPTGVFLIRTAAYSV